MLDSQSLLLFFLCFTPITIFNRPKFTGWSNIFIVSPQQEKNLHKLHLIWSQFYSTTSDKVLGLKLSWTTETTDVTLTSCQCQQWCTPIQPQAHQAWNAETKIKQVLMHRLVLIMTDLLLIISIFNTLLYCIVLYKEWEEGRGIHMPYTSFLGGPIFITKPAQFQMLVSIKCSPVRWSAGHAAAWLGRKCRMFHAARNPTCSGRCNLPTGSGQSCCQRPVCSGLLAGLLY